MRKTIFTEQELTEKGFELVHDGGERYMQYIFNKDNYLESPFLATEEIVIPRTDVFYTVVHSVINSVNPDNGEPYLTEEEIDDLIKNGI